VKRAVLLAFLLVLNGCATGLSGIGSNVTECCADADDVTFTIAPVNIPAFLGPLMVSNLSVAFAGKGLQPVMEDADLAITLRFEQIDLTQQIVKDGFDESISPGGEVRFIAKMIVEVRKTGSDGIMWSGSIQRTHTVSPGEYMHTGKASIALLDAFNELLVNYPGTPSD
jgi:hypothetical protein